MNTISDPQIINGTELRVGARVLNCIPTATGITSLRAIVSEFLLDGGELVGVVVNWPDAPQERWITSAEYLFPCDDAVWDEKALRWDAMFAAEV